MQSGNFYFLFYLYAWLIYVKTHDKRNTKLKSILTILIGPWTKKMLTSVLNNHFPVSGLFDSSNITDIHRLFAVKKINS